MICFRGESSAWEFFLSWSDSRKLPFWLWVPPRLKVFLVWVSALEGCDKGIPASLGSTAFLVLTAPFQGLIIPWLAFVFSIDVSFKPIKMGRDFKQDCVFIDQFYTKALVLN